MYLGNVGGYGTSDFNKALKGTDIAKIQKGLDFQIKQLSKRKPKDTKGIENDKAQIAAAQARLAELNAAKAPPPPVAQAPVTPSPVPQVGPPAPSVAPLPAAVSTTPPILPAPLQNFAATVPQSMLPVPSVLDSPSASSGDATPVAPATDSKMPLILGAAGLGLLALFFLKKKRG